MPTELAARPSPLVCCPACKGRGVVSRVFALRISRSGGVRSMVIRCAYNVEINLARALVYRHSMPIHVTMQEWLMLSTLADAGEAVSCADMSAVLWGGLGQHSASNHRALTQVVHRLRLKLGVKPGQVLLWHSDMMRLQLEGEPDGWKKQQPR